MKMRISGIVGIVAATVCSAWAQQPTTASLKTFASSAEVRDMIAHAKAIRKTEPLIVQPILQLEPYRADLEYRASVGPAAIHEKQAEMFYIIDGAATLVTGGKLVNENRSNAENLSGSAIAGGTSQAVAKGDFAIVPENTPHWFNDIQGTLVLMSIKMPRPAK